MDARIVLPVLALVALAFVLVPVALAVGSWWRNSKRVSCPRDGRGATITVKPLPAAVAALVGARRLVLADCSLFPERGDCARSCLRAPEEAFRPIA